MRILVATDQWFPDHIGGVARVATDTARAWARRGHEVVVIAPRRGAPERTDDGALTLLRVLPRGRLPQTLTDAPATRRAARRAAGDGFDVAVGHASTVASGLLAAWPGLPLLYVFHASPADEARLLRQSRRTARDVVAAVAFEGTLRRQTQRVLGRAASIAVLSEFSRTVLAQTSAAAAQTAELVSGAVDTEHFSPADRESARARLGVSRVSLVFTVRRIEPRMGLENLVEAVALLDDVPNLRVVVAGTGDGRKLEALRNRLGLEERVQLIGRVGDDELRLWHRAADLFVLPSIAYEGFGLVTAEALASGTPVVGTAVGATPELLEPLEPRLVSRGLDPAALAETIRSGLALATPSLRARCREYALARLSWDAVLPAWERMLEDTVRRGGRVAAPLLEAAPVHDR
jgi:glycosyltransferase involved in cell wall biosynthesis